MDITKEILESILDAYAYEIVFVDRNHIVQYMNKTAKQRYGNRVVIGNSLFNCHNENSKHKIEEFLKRADNGEDEMLLDILKDMKCLGIKMLQKFQYLNIGNIVFNLL